LKNSCLANKVIVGKVLLKISGSNLSKLRFDVDLAALALKNGALVAFPTETVYGLGGDATNPASVARIYEVKGRPADHPLIVHISSLAYLNQWASEIPTYAISLADKLWPGPMTLILKRSNLAKDFVTGGQDTVGIRIPNNVDALSLIDSFHKIGGLGIAAPSANRFGQISPTTARAVKEELGDYLSSLDLILDGGQSTVGLESTIIDCTGDIPKILRPGAITVSMIENVTQLKTVVNSVFAETQNESTIESRNHWESNSTMGLETSAIRVSGSLESHYAPKARVILDQEPRAGCGFIALEDVETPKDVIRLASPKSIEDFARCLYSALRDGDKQNLSAIYIIQPVGHGLEVAIRDRLGRAARGRPS